MERKIEGRMEQKKSCKKRRNRGNGCMCRRWVVGKKKERRGRKKGHKFRRVYRVLYNWRFYKVQMNRKHSLLLMYDVWGDALIIPEAFGLGEC